MKRTLIILAGLFVFSIVTICWAGISVNAELDNVQFEERVVYGDKSIVEGVTVCRNLKWNEALYWSTTCTLGEVPASETEVDFYTYGKGDKFEGYYDPLQFTYIDSYFSMEEGFEPTTGIQKALLELAKESPAGETSYKTIALKDYSDYYPFGLYLNFAAFFVHIQPNEENFLWTDKQGEDYTRVLEHFNEFFRIPVLEEDVCTIGVNKADDGELLGYGFVNAEHGEGSNEFDIDIDTQENWDTFLFEISAVTTKDTCYFTFFPYSHKGKPVDTSLIPGGYGVYSFKFNTEEGTIEEDSLKLVYSMDPSGYVNLNLDEQQENLLVFEEGEGESGEKESYLTVLDVETMEEKQTLALGVLDEDNSAKCYWIYEDFVIAQYDYYEAALLSRNEDGTYHLEFKIPAEQVGISGKRYFLDGENCFDWNGEQLLVAGVSNEVPASYVVQEFVSNDIFSGNEMPYYGRYAKQCSFFVGVFDVNGLAYYGVYDCSLDTDYYSDTSCESTWMDTISINWN